MKKIIISTDSFKGTLTASEATKIIAEEFEKVVDAKVIQLPIADGGEGSLELVKGYCGGKIITDEFTALTGEKVLASYLMLDDQTAFIESAQTVGLTLAKNSKTVEKFTTFGVGEQILHAIKKGAKKFFVALGGSGTNDFGCGLACALGVKFFDANNEQFIPVGENLKSVEKIDFSACEDTLSNCEIFALCDVDNPPYGKNGAAYIYAPQKGASKEICKTLDDGVKHLCELVLKAFGKDIHNLKGGGAAGAMGAGLFAFCNAKIISGIDFMLNASGIRDKLENCDLIVTGEGCTDEQTLNGKVVSGIGRICAQNGIPVVVISGRVKGNLDLLSNIGITKIFSTTNSVKEIDKDGAIENLKSSANYVAKLIYQNRLI